MSQIGEEKQAATAAWWVFGASSGKPARTRVAVSQSCVSVSISVLVAVPCYVFTVEETGEGYAGTFRGLFVIPL